MNSRIEFWARMPWFVVVGGTCLMTSQCTLMVDAQREQCASTADCRQRGGDFSGSVCQNSACVPDPAWSCRELAASSTVTSGATFVVRVPVVSVITKAGMAGISARLYPKIDVDLAQPIGDAVVSDANGILEFHVASGFDGFMTLEHSAIGPSLYFFNPPVERDLTVAAVRLASVEMVGALLKQVGRSFDPTRGVVVLTAEDCNAQPAEGISYSSSAADSATQAFYSVEGLPTTTTAATDSSGYGGLIGMLPGTTAISGSHALQGSIGRISLIVKAGTVTYSRMVPSAE